MNISIDDICDLLESVILNVSPIEQPSCVGKLVKRLEPYLSDEVLEVYRL